MARDARIAGRGSDSRAVEVILGPWFAGRGSRAMVHRNGQVDASR